MGCGWYTQWMENVKEARLEYGQRLKAAVFPGQGVGGLQKVELAAADSMGWQYDEIDVAEELEERFPKGCVVDAWCEERNCWRRGTVEAQKGSSSTTCEANTLVTWTVRCEGEGGEDDVFEASHICDTSVATSEMLHHLGRDLRGSGKSDGLKTHDMYIHVSCATVWDLELTHSLDNPGRPKLRQLVLECLPDVVLLDVGTYRFPSGLSALELRLEVRSIGALHRLRDQVLSDNLQRHVSGSIRGPSSDSSWQVEVDKTQFFLWYEDAMLQLKELTPHQEKCLRDIDHFDSVHLSAPAGAGKTFVAVQRVIDLLRGDASARVLYVSYTTELVYYFIQWLVVRLTSQLQSESWNEICNLLARLVVLKSPFRSFLSPRLENDRINLAPAEKVDKFELLVVDEAHNIFRADVERHALDRVSCSNQLLLSDDSQSSAMEVNIPPMESVVLTEVVRSTRQIVVGASSFQLESLAVAAGADGPALKSFIFEDSGNQNLMSQYAKHVADAVVHVTKEYPDISLHKRVALLVPDDDFLRELKKALKPELGRRLPHKHYRFDSFAESLCHLPERARRMRTQPSQQMEHLILDTIAVADGLEQLIVVCIGLDAPICGAARDLATRAGLYKGITRAQLKAIVVNAHVPNGWFEFLSSVRFSEQGLSEEEASKYKSHAAIKICQEAKDDIGRAKQQEPSVEAKQPSRQTDSKEEHSDVGRPQPETRSASTADKKTDPGMSQPETENIAPEREKTPQHASSVWDTRNNTVPVHAQKPMFDPLAKDWGRLSVHAILMSLRSFQGISSSVCPALRRTEPQSVPKSSFSTRCPRTGDCLVACAILVPLCSVLVPSVPLSGARSCRPRFRMDVSVGRSWRCVLRVPQVFASLPSPEAARAKA